MFHKLPLLETPLLHRHSCSSLRAHMRTGTHHTGTHHAGTHTRTPPNQAPHTPLPHRRSRSRLRAHMRTGTHLPPAPRLRPTPRCLALSRSLHNQPLRQVTPRSLHIQPVLPRLRVCTRAKTKNTAFSQMKMDI